MWILKKLDYVIKIFMNFNNIFCLNWRGGYIANKGVEYGSEMILKMMKNNSKKIDIYKLSMDNLSNHEYHKHVFEERLKKKKFNSLVLGGDHSIAIGSIFASLAIKDKLGVIWIDAHPDINTIESSQTKREHGMPLSFLTGIEKTWDWTKDLKKLDFKDLHYWGIRDFDEFEKKLLQDKKIRLDHNLNSILKVCEKYENLHISFDIDALDPLYTPSTGTPVSNGLSLEEIKLFFESIKKKNICLDIVEYNPELGGQKEKKITYDSINSILDILTTV